MDTSTPEQQALLLKVLRSHVFTDAEREHAATLLRDGDRDRVSAHLDWVLREVKDRKRREREQARANH